MIILVMIIILLIITIIILYLIFKLQVMNCEGASICLFFNLNSLRYEDWVLIAICTYKYQY